MHKRKDEAKDELADAARRHKDCKPNEHQLLQLLHKLPPKEGRLVLSVEKAYGPR